MLYAAFSLSLGLMDVSRPGESVRSEALEMFSSGFSALLVQEGSHIRIVGF